MPNPYEMDWNNLDLDCDREFNLIDGMSIGHFLDVVVPANCAIKSRRHLIEEFNARLKAITEDARDVFRANLDNFFEYVNRDEVADAITAKRDAVDQNTMQRLAIDFHSNTRTWRAISQEWFDWMLECLPPIRQGRGGFMNSEAHSSLRDGQEVYFTALKVNGTCYAAYGTLAEWDAKLLILSDHIPKW